MGRFAALAAEAEEHSPMSNGTVDTIPGRLLLADGDGLCYYCAGKDDTEPGLARYNLIEKLRSAARASGAESIKVVTTSRGCHKGYRYAVARVKPYQGQRTNSRRPKNWEFLRRLLEAGDLGPGIEVEFTDIAEADDLFARYAKTHPDCVIYTQDKDMRMVPGWHLDWLTHLMFKLEPGTWAVMHAEKLWGRKWFWSQMLHGDTADNIPGLPGYVVDGKTKKVGEVTAGKLLDNLSSDAQCITHVGANYASLYGDRWVVEMLEQGILLWMRDDRTSSALNVVAPGNPLHGLSNHELYPKARAEIMARIAEAVVHETTQDNGSGSDPDITLDIPGQQVRPVQAPVLGESGGAGSRPLDGDRPLDAAPGVQRPAGQGGEQLQEVRGDKPRGVPQWGRSLLAKARH